MDKNVDLNTVKYSGDKKEAVAAFNRLLYANELSKEDALWLCENAPLRVIRNLASKFLGKMTPGKKKTLGCLFYFMLFSGLIYYALSWAKGCARTKSQQAYAQQTQADSAQTKLDKLVGDMRAARKRGLPNNCKLQEEQAYPDYELKILMAGAEATTYGRRYFGTMQLGDSDLSPAGDGMFFVATTPNDEKTGTAFLLYQSGNDPLLKMTHQGYSVNKAGAVTELYGSWNSYQNPSINGYYLAKLKGDQLQVQIFRNQSNKLLYWGRILLQKTK